MAIYKREYKFTGRVKISNADMPVKVSYSEEKIIFTPKESSLVFSEDNPQVKIIISYGPRSEVIDMGELYNIKEKEIDSFPESATYRLVVVCDKRIIASGRISKRRGAGSLLDLEESNISPMMWKLRFPDGDEDEKVSLVLNSEVPDIKMEILNNPIYRAMILPEAIRQIVQKIYTLGYSSVSEALNNEEGWVKDWIRFVERIHPTAMPLYESVADENHIDHFEQWTSLLLEKFSGKNRLHDKALAYYREKDND